MDTYVPELEPSDDPNAWLPGDALFVPLRDTRHQLLGVISVDEPETGLRPSDEELDVLVTISRHAALALRIGQDIANDMEHQRMLERVLEVSARLAEASDVDARPAGRLRRHPGRARVREGADRDRRRSPAGRS